MTALLTPAVLSPGPSLSAGICGLLQVLTRGASEKDSIHAQAHAGSVQGLVHVSAGVREAGSEWIPPQFLRALEDRSTLPWRVSLSAMHGRSGLDPASLSAVAASWTIERVYRNPSKPDSPNGKRWAWPEDRVAEILAGLEGFTVPPTIVVSGLPIVVAVWALDRPMPVKDPVSQARALLLLRALAATLEADVPAEDARLADLSVPLPGTSPANPGGDWEPVTVAAFHPGRIHPLANIEAAVSAAKRK